MARVHQDHGGSYRLGASARAKLALGQAGVVAMADDVIGKITANLTMQQAVRQLVGRIWFAIIANDQSEWKERMESEIALYAPLLVPEAVAPFQKQMRELLPFYQRVRKDAYQVVKRAEENKTAVARAAKEPKAKG